MVEDYDDVDCVKFVSSETLDLDEKLWSMLKPVVGDSKVTLGYKTSRDTENVLEGLGLKAEKLLKKHEDRIFYSGAPGDENAISAWVDSEGIWENLHSYHKRAAGDGLTLKKVLIDAGL